MTKDQQKEIQQKYMELQMIESQVQQVQKQIEAIDSQLVEIKIVEQGLSDLEGMNPGSEVLMPVTNGIFAKASLKKADSLLVNVGNNVVVEKTPDETKAMMQKQHSEITRVRGELLGQMQQLTEQAMLTEQELRKYISG